jgi:hypothetical protein
MSLPAASAVCGGVSCGPCLMNEDEFRREII